MNKKDYLIRKKQLDDSPDKTRVNKRCLVCHRKHITCLCTECKSVKTPFKFIILMHPMEAKKERNGTGRLAHLCLDNSEIHMGINFTEHNKVNELINDTNNDCFMMYPGNDTFNVDDQNFSQKIDYKKQTVLFLLDATWPCAKKMLKKSRNLISLRRVSFTNKKESLFAIKHQPIMGCLSTIESVYYFLEKVKNDELNVNGEEHLLSVLKKLVDFQIKCAKDSSLSGYRRDGGYSNPESREQSQKWNKRKLFID
ncbi:MAG: DTW domain-containing protein YfiP [Thermoproteota archaeon]|jgi:DTW domain-containing protein YfiP